MSPVKALFYVIIIVALVVISAYLVYTSKQRTADVAGKIATGLSARVNGELPSYSIQASCFGRVQVHVWMALTLD